MDKLIPIDYSNPERPTVSGRELHKFLGIDTPYAKWFGRMVEYGFTEGKDFVLVAQKCATNNPRNPVKNDRLQGGSGRKVAHEVLDKNVQNPLGGRPGIDHQLTIPMAKELCMLQRNERGKLARRYFLAVEEQWNSPEAVMRRAVLLADKKVKLLQSEKRELAAQVEDLTPKATFADAVCSSGNSILIGELAKLISQNGVPIGPQRLFCWMREHGYLIRRRGDEYNLPTQRSMERGWFELKQTAVIHSDGRTIVSITPKVTGKGQIYFINLFLSKEKGEDSMKKVPLPSWCVEVKRAMIEHGDMTVTDLAKETGYSRSHISSIVNGSMRPSGEVKDAIENCLGIH